MKLYIAGPMRGYVDYNFPAFHAMAKKLRDAGHEVVSPAEMDEAAYGTQDGIDAAAKKKNALREFMARDLPALLACDGVVLLDGWNNSQGAAIESFVAAMTGIPLYTDARLSDTISIYRLLVIVGSKIVGEANERDVPRGE